MHALRQILNIKEEENETNNQLNAKNTNINR